MLEQGPASRAYFGNDELRPVQAIRLHPLRTVCALPCPPCRVPSLGYDRQTKYVYVDLGRDDEDHAGFDDVRAVAMALAEVKPDGLETWIGTALSTTLLGDIGPLQAMVDRGLNELRSLFKFYGVK